MAHAAALRHGFARSLPGGGSTCRAPGGRSGLRYFEAATFDEAMPLARAVYAGARHCVCCRRVLARQYDCLGSTLFRDDDPYELARSFDVADGDVCTVRMLAACIVLFARDRESVH